jgi:hypothetical protein
VRRELRGAGGKLAALLVVAEKGFARVTVASRGERAPQLAPRSDDAAAGEAWPGGGLGRVRTRQFTRPLP